MTFLYEMQKEKKSAKVMFDIHADVKNTVIIISEYSYTIHSVAKL